MFVNVLIDSHCTNIIEYIDIIVLYSFHNTLTPVSYTKNLTLLYKLEVSMLPLFVIFLLDCGAVSIV
jgi:hypothetical protein